MRFEQHEVNRLRELVVELRHCCVRYRVHSVPARGELRSLFLPPKVHGTIDLHSKRK